jgi:hypothetical protein
MMPPVWRLFAMTDERCLTDAEIRRRRPGVRASLACEGIYLTPEDDALFDQMDEQRLTADQRIRRIIDLSQAERSRLWIR